MSIFSPLAASDVPLAFTPPADPDDAYENRLHIPHADQHMTAWPVDAAAFRDRHPDSDCHRSYGTGERTAYDLFLPAGGLEAAQGLIAFIHGGYWVALSKNDFSHLASGLLDRGWAVAMIGYTLAPQSRIAGITQEIATAITALGDVGTGPLRLAGHSAGGHLVTRMMCRDVDLGTTALARMDRVVSISGLHDLRPLRELAKNEIWQLDDDESVQESPVLQRPRPGIDLVCVAGADERPEFIRQNALLPLAWQGLGVTGHCQLLAGHNHFTIIETMTDPDSALCQLITVPVDHRAI
ncbi:MAG: alpha/beta hydrolase [Candidatus Puniceispirillaceae bacterium]|jgi:arylformamidase